MGLTVFSEVQQTFVEHLQIFRVPRESEAIAGLGVPRADSQEAAIFVLRCQIVQHCPVVYECVQISEKRPALEKRSKDTKA